MSPERSIAFDDHFAGVRSDVSRSAVSRSAPTGLGGISDADLREIRSWYFDLGSDWGQIEARLICEIVALRTKVAKLRALLEAGDNHGLAG